MDVKRSTKKIACTTSGMGDGSQIRILTSGDLFVYSDHGNDVWVYGVNSWGQKLLSGFTPINLSLSGTTLYYDGMDAQGNYIVGKIDVLTKANTTLNVGVVDELIGFN
jgi:hypothetical protein